MHTLTTYLKRGLLVTALLLGLLSAATTITAKTVYDTLSFSAQVKSAADFEKGGLTDVSLTTVDGRTTLGTNSNRGGMYISPVMEAPFEATHVGVHWEEDVPRGAFLSVSVRTSSDGVHFSEWVQTTTEEGFAPNGFESDETFAALVGTQKGKYAQAKVVFTPGDGAAPVVRSLSITFINSAEESSREVKKLAFVGQALAEVFFTPKTSPNSQNINVISREQWGADETDRLDALGEESWPRSYHGTRKIVIHHTADLDSNGETDITENISTVRAIYEYHAVTQGWGDIGYNALVDASGNIYEGRYGAHGADAIRTDLTDNDVLVLDVEGAHVSGYNSGTFGVAAMGEFTSYPVPSLQLSAMEDVLAYVSDSRGIDTTSQSDYLRYNDTWDFDVPNVFGHSDAGITACPGDNLYEEIDPMKADVAARLLSPLSGFKATANESSVSGGNAEGFDVVVSWNEFPGASGYEYFVENVVGIVDVAETSELWEDAWFQNENTQVTSGTSITLEANTLEDEQEYVVYVRAVNTSQPISLVSHVDFVKSQSIVVDNLDLDYITTYGTNEWLHSTNVSGYYGDNYQSNRGGVGDDIFEWTPPLLNIGYYDISVMYSAASDRGLAQYTVFSQDQDGVQLENTVSVNQQINGGTWVPLGNYYYDGIAVMKVQLSDDISRRYSVIADAVNFTFDRPSDTVVNQAPVADAGSNQSVLIDTLVTFDGSASYDEGELTYAWNFGDSAEGTVDSTVTSPTHTYVTEGVYTATLTVTDDDSAFHSDSVTITVTNDDEPIVSEMSISEISVTLIKKGSRTQATAEITIVDLDGAPVEGATVSGTWSGETTDSDSAITNRNGKVFITSDSVKSTGGEFTFTVDTVEKEGWIYLDI